VERTPRKDRDTTPDRYIVRSILSPFDEAIDLSDEEFAIALEETNRQRKAVGKDQTDRPAGPSVRSVRGKRPQNGLLIVYPIDPVIAGIATERPVIGVVISFPDSETARRRTYLENTVRQREEQS
jgi:hypothetical protein